jgi:hypothetical protein
MAVGVDVKTRRLVAVSQAVGTGNPVSEVCGVTDRTQVLVRTTLRQLQYFGV